MELSSLVIVLLVFLLSSHLETSAILASVFSSTPLVFSSYFLLLTVLFPLTSSLLSCCTFPRFTLIVFTILAPSHLSFCSFISCPAHDHTNSKQGNKLEGMDFCFFSSLLFSLLFFFILKQYLPDLCHPFLCMFFLFLVFSTPLPFTYCLSFSFASSFLFFSAFSHFTL